MTSGNPADDLELADSGGEDQGEDSDTDDEQDMFGALRESDESDDD